MALMPCEVGKFPPGRKTSVFTGVLLKVELYRPSPTGGIWVYLHDRVSVSA